MSHHYRKRHAKNFRESYIHFRDTLIHEKKSAIFLAKQKISIFYTREAQIPDCALPTHYKARVIVGVCYVYISR